MTHRRLLLLALSLLWGLGPSRSLWGQLVNPAIADPVVTFTVELNEAASATRRDLERGEAFLKNRQWDEGIETFRRILEESSDRVLPASYGAAAPGPFAVYLPVRDYVQMRLARLAREAPEALARYRGYVDPVARQWLKEATAEKDAERLERLLRTMFVSSYGDDALLLLGEIELERGNLATARGLWERISPRLRTPASRHGALPLPGGLPWWFALQGVDLERHWDDLAPVLEDGAAPAHWLAYPDTDLNLAEVRARLALVSILEGSLDRAASELAVFARLHPTATGTLGGRTGTLHELLATLLEQSRAWPEAAPPADWPTFAGAQDRNRRASGPVDMAGRPLWVRAFDQTFTSANESSDYGFVRSAPSPAPAAQPPVALLSYHPAIVGDLVLYSDWRHIYALQLRTGEPAVPLGLTGRQTGAITPPDADGLPFDASLGGRSLGAPRFTLNAVQGRLTARLGSPLTGETPGSFPLRSPGYLFSLDLTTFKQLHPRIVPDGPEWSFEGAPVTDGARLYVAMRQSEIRAGAYVACFDLRSGERLWRRKICSAETMGQGQRREITHNLLTLAEGTLYFNTNLGAVAALRVPDGDIRWVARYPRISRRRDEERQDPRFLRDVNPCLFHRGIVVCFPTDCHQMFALDAASGQFLWATPEESTPDVAHLLGVAGDHLIASGAYLYWLNVYSGRFLAQFPENAYFAPGRELPNPHGHGRGVLAGDVIYWPTQSNTDSASGTQQMQIQVIRQRLRRTERAWQAERLREIDLTARVPGLPLEGANLVVGHGVLLLATPQHLIAFGE